MLQLSKNQLSKVRKKSGNLFLTSCYFLLAGIFKLILRVEDVGKFQN